MSGDWDAFHLLAERRIEQAQQEGAFQNLPGQGRPLPKDDDHGVPADLRMGYKILKNAGCLPPELEVRKEICQLADLLSGMEAGEERKAGQRRMQALLQRLSQLRPGNLRLEGEYFAKIAARLAGEADQE